MGRLNGTSANTSILTTNITTKAIAESHARLHFKNIFLIYKSI